MPLCRRSSSVCMHNYVFPSLLLNSCFFWSRDVAFWSLWLLKEHKVLRAVTVLLNTDIFCVYCVVFHFSCLTQFSFSSFLISLCLCVLIMGTHKIFANLFQASYENSESALQLELINWTCWTYIRIPRRRFTKFLLVYL